MMYTKTWLMIGAVALMIAGCRYADRFEGRRPPAVSKPLAKAKGERTMTEDILYYSEVEAMPGITIYTAPTTYTFSNPENWSYDDAKLVFNSYDNSWSELYIFESEQTYLTSGNCDREYLIIPNGNETYIDCSTGQTFNCRKEGNCIIKCQDDRPA